MKNKLFFLVFLCSFYFSFTCAVKTEEVKCENLSKEILEKRNKSILLFKKIKQSITNKTDVLKKIRRKMRTQNEKIYCRLFFHKGALTFHWGASVLKGCIEKKWFSAPWVSLLGVNTIGYFVHKKIIHSQQDSLNNRFKENKKKYYAFIESNFESLNKIEETVRNYSKNSSLEKIKTNCLVLDMYNISKYNQELKDAINTKRLVNDTVLDPCTLKKI